jgi:threonine dehydratase
MPPNLHSAFCLVACLVGNCLTFVVSYDHPHILAGQGTMGLEIISQVPDVYAVIIPVGGGGLIAGAALAIKTLNPDVKVYVSRMKNLWGYPRSFFFYFGISIIL